MIFIEAHWKTIAHRKRIDVIVIHTMEVPCQTGMATRVARGFASGDQEDRRLRRSAHYCIDPIQVVQCVIETDVAWHCPGANRRGIGIEHAGYAFGGEHRTATDWDSPEAKSELSLSAFVVADICHRWDIPPVRLTPEELIAGQKGIVGHVDATMAFSTPGGHRDPGPHWPWDRYLVSVTEELAKLS